MKPLYCIAVLMSTFCLSLSAHAERAWLLPSATVLAGREQWITVDAAESDQLFFFNHAALSLNGLKIIAPDGSLQLPEQLLQGKLRTTFDLHLRQQGTWKISALEPSTGERCETYVSLGQPTTHVTEPTGLGLEIHALTHPNDLVSTKPASFTLLLDGKPQAYATVMIVPGSDRYPNHADSMALKTDNNGQFWVRWPHAGLYLMQATLSSATPTAEVAQQGLSNQALDPVDHLGQQPIHHVEAAQSIALTLEVLPKS